MGTILPGAGHLWFAAADPQKWSLLFSKSGPGVENALLSDWWTIHNAHLKFLIGSN